MRLTAGILVPDYGLCFVQIIDRRECGAWFKYATEIIDSGMAAIIDGDVVELEGAVPLILYDIGMDRLISPRKSKPAKIGP